jgi:hypothetical protein
MTHKSQLTTRLLYWGIYYYNIIIFSFLYITFLNLLLYYFYPPNYIYIKISQFGAPITTLPKKGLTGKAS